MTRAHQAFLEKAKQVLAENDEIIGLGIGGSYLTNEIDAYSDLDLVAVTKGKITNDPENMFAVARSIGPLLCGFTGEPRVLICLYDDPLLHVDIKFLTPDEFQQRIENPSVVMDKDGSLQRIITNTSAQFPYPDYQWIEDRFWIWVHYALLKIGRGEYMEALDFFSAIRAMVLGPLLHIKSRGLPRGVRKVETQLAKEDFEKLKETVPNYAKTSLLTSLDNVVGLYRELRNGLFAESIKRQTDTEEKVMAYFKTIKERVMD